MRQKIVEAKPQDHFEKKQVLCRFFVLAAADIFRSNISMSEINRSTVAHWQLDLASRTITRSANHDSYFGYPQNLPVWNIEMFIIHLLPEDNETFISRMRDIITAGKDFEYLYRVVWRDGSIHNLRSWGRFQNHPETNQPYRIIGMTDFVE
ncbi:MAG: PAS domain-containing protein [Bdellovibrionota bacterium]